MGSGAARAAAGTLDLLVPGLLGPVPIAPGQVPPVPVLERVLARSSRAPGEADLGQALFAAFGVTPPAGPWPDLPSAPFCYLADCSAGDRSGYRLHADPVHLRLDRDHLVLYDARHLDLTQAEADALVGLFNGHFGSRDLALDAPLPGRWYLRVGQPPRLRSWPLDAVTGRPVTAFLPSGEDARPWAALLNEAQMLFASAEPNLRREAAGRLPVSGIWVWGGGSLNAVQPVARYGAVVADHPLAAGLARQTGAALHPLGGVEGGLPGLAVGSPVLVVWDRLWHAVVDADAMTWAAELMRLEAFLVSVQNLLRGGRLERWTLDSCGAGAWRIDRRDAWRLWRRTAPLAAVLARGKGRGEA
jgi:hypothetical protein